MRVGKEPTARAARRSIGCVASSQQGAALRGSFLRCWAASTALVVSAVEGRAGQSSPSVPLFGAYFPSWLICAFMGTLGAIGVRVVFVRVGIDDLLPWRLPVYVSMASAIAFGCALFIYGR